MMPLTCGRTSDTAKGSVRPGSSAVSVHRLLLDHDEADHGGGICGCCCGWPQAARAAATAMT